MTTSKLQLWQRRVASKLDALGFTPTDIARLTGATVQRIRDFLSGANPDPELLYVVAVARLLVKTPCPHCAADVLTLRTVAEARCDTCYRAFPMVTLPPDEVAKPPRYRPLKAKSEAPVITRRKARAAAALAHKEPPPTLPPPAQR